jgi:hypothetical protein
MDALLPLLGPLEFSRCTVAFACCIRVVEAARDDDLDRCSIGSHSRRGFCLDECRPDLEVLVCLGLRTSESGIVCRDDYFRAKWNDHSRRLGLVSLQNSC